MDLIANQAGAWGPECKITKFIDKPQGRLTQGTWDGAISGDFLYTPPGIGTEKVRFILENGAGKQVDVTVELITTEWIPEEGGAVDGDRSVLVGANDGGAGVTKINGVPVSISPLQDGVLGQTEGGTGSSTITLDTTAAGHGWYIDYTPLAQRRVPPHFQFQ